MGVDNLYVPSHACAQGSGTQLSSAVESNMLKTFF